MNYGLLRRTTTARQATLEKELREARATVAASEKELHSIGQILAALKGTEGAAVSARRGKAKAKSKRRKGGKWKKGRPGRPPKWYTEKMKGKATAKKASKATKPAKKAKRKKRTASPKMLAALAKARAARAAKRTAMTATETAPS